MLLEASWGLLEASWAPPENVWKGSRPSKKLFVRLWARLGPPHGLGFGGNRPPRGSQEASKTGLKSTRAKKQKTLENIMFFSMVLCSRGGSRWAQNRSKIGNIHTDGPKSCPKCFQEGSESREKCLRGFQIALGLVLDDFGYEFVGF